MCCKLCKDLSLLALLIGSAILLSQASVAAELTTAQAAQLKQTSLKVEKSNETSSELEASLTEAQIYRSTVETPTKIEASEAAGAETVIQAAQ